MRASACRCCSSSSAAAAAAGTEDDDDDEGPPARRLPRWLLRLLLRRFLRGAPVARLLMLLWRRSWGVLSTCGSTRRRSPRAFALCLLLRSLLLCRLSTLWVDGTRWTRRPLRALWVPLHCEAALSRRPCDS